MKNLMITSSLIFILQFSQAQSITLDELISAPFLSNLVISTKTDQLAWVENKRGARNIFVSGPPNYTPEQITGYLEDDGIEITNLHWTDDEKNLIYVRGNAPQIRASQPHNPAHLLEGTASVIRKYNVDTKTSETIGLGGSPSFHDNIMVFIRGGQIYLKNISDSVPPQQLCQIRGSAGQLRWSPDGSKLAFVNNRGKHSFIGVYDFSMEDYAFVDAAIDRDTEPVWSHDSHQIAFLRLREGSYPIIPFFPLKTNEPWSIIMANVKNITDISSKNLFTANKGIGSAYWPHTGKQQLFWTENDKIIFTWEKNGWQQLYAVSINDGKVSALTNGKFEVDEVLLSPDKRSIIFSSNEGNLSKKDIYKVNPEDGKPSVIVEDLKNSSYGIEFNICLSADGQTVFYLRSDARSLPEVVMAKAGKLVRSISTNNLSFQKEKLSTPEVLTLKAKDDLMFESQVFYPQNMKKDKSHPAVIFVHGGSRRQMYPAYHSSWYYANAYHMCQYFASKGYVAMSINFRSGIGYGQEFREADDYGASGNSEFQDLEAAGEWLKMHPAVSQAKIGVWGGSYGGYMTAMALARRSDLFAAGADIHGVHNWNTEIPAFMPAYDSLKFKKHAQLAFKSSPVYYLDSWKSPVLLAHGDDDQNVPFSETMHMVKLLGEKGIEHRLVVVPDEVHGFLRYKSWSQIFNAVTSFFEEKLGNTK